MSTKRTVLNFMREQAYKPLMFEELVKVFEIPNTERKMFEDVLNEMEQEGLIIKNRKDRYGVPERMNLVVGRLQGHTKGFGFLIPDNPEQQDIYINLNDMNGAMHNDKVVVRIMGGKGTEKLSGEIVKILERKNKTVVGNYEDSKHFGFVVPDDSRIYHDVFIPRDERKGAREGYKVVAELTSWPEKGRNPEGKIIEILGHKQETGVDIEAIIRKADLPQKFPEEVRQQVEEIPEEIPAQEIEMRKDLRDLKMVTIDGEDAKDFDDAVSLDILGEQKVRLGVHIADVTYYVKQGSSLDQEALKRGTSVYLVDRVIPMLPEKLSNNLCSLRSNENRLAMSVLMDFDLETGELLDYEFVKSVIKVNHRLTYNKVKRMLVDKEEELIEQYDDVFEELELMAELSKLIRKERHHKGSIDFDFPEAKIILDQEGSPVDIAKVERTIAEKLIEDFMIKTNEVVAQDMYFREIPFIYRVHEQPPQDKLEDLNSFIHNFGYHIKGRQDEIHPKALQEVLEKVVGEPEERIINTVLLRTMQQAHYSPYNIGHFGLASEYYSHFTSPIRRYPDLMIHRIIKEAIEKEVISENKKDNLENRLVGITDHCSVQERKAMEAERETLDLKKVEYMKDKVEQEYEGIISSVMPFGFFVELDNTIEGLVHVSSMTDDYYHYHEDEQSFIGERTAKKYQLGEKVRVKVSRANVEERQVDFDLVIN
ncbi:ribonuclease R [Natroniella acetigena]|uniref:ribonuclease R n=1 Tax=Natroniella acetigena TaxID=52004 RepID=UPI00200AAD4E|nr:ribonuclease R [Natroniella acetigena]MCK8828467.1 ribonuclease R [Natroniella acetigena]